MKTIRVTAAIMIKDERVLIAQRHPDDFMGGKWEFPGGKLEPDESPEESLARELQEELGVEIRVGKILEVVYHRYPEKNVLLLFYTCELINGEPQPLEVEEVAWVSTRDLPQLDWVPADIPLVRRLWGGLDQNSGQSALDPR